jgi:hypothetical protein
VVQFVGKSLVNFVSLHRDTSYLIACTHALLSITEFRDFLCELPLRDHGEILLGHFQNLAQKLWSVKLGSIKPGGLLKHLEKNCAYSFRQTPSGYFEFVLSKIERELLLSNTGNCQDLSTIFKNFLIYGFFCAN